MASSPLQGQVNRQTDNITDEQTHSYISRKESQKTNRSWQEYRQPWNNNFEVSEETMTSSLSHVDMISHHYHITRHIAAPAWRYLYYYVLPWVALWSSTHVPGCLCVLWNTCDNVPSALWEIMHCPSLSLTAQHSTYLGGLALRW